MSGPAEHQILTSKGAPAVFYALYDFGHSLEFHMAHSSLEVHKARSSLEDHVEVRNFLVLRTYTHMLVRRLGFEQKNALVHAGSCLGPAQYSKH